MKEIICQHCGKAAAVIGIGKPPTNITVTDICDALLLYRSARAAAENLGCSRPLIYKILKQHGMSPTEVINGESSLLSKS